MGLGYLQTGPFLDHLAVIKSKDTKKKLMLITVEVAG